MGGMGVFLMRWFRHFTDAHSHPDHVYLMSEFGAAGYGLYWLVCERCALHGDEDQDFSVTFPTLLWHKLMGSRVDVWNKFIMFEKKIGNFRVNINSDETTISIPNLKKYRDEYSAKKSRSFEKNPDSVRTKSGQHPASYTDTDTDTEQSKTDTEGSPPCSHDEPSTGPPEPAKSKNGAPPRAYYAENVSMTVAEYEKLVAQYGAFDVQRMVAKLDNFKGATGKKYKSDYRAILNWVVDAVLGKPAEKPAAQAFDTGADVRYPTPDEAAAIAAVCADGIADQKRREIEYQRIEQEAHAYRMGEAGRQMMQEPGKEAP